MYNFIPCVVVAFHATCWVKYVHTYFPGSHTPDTKVLPTIAWREAIVVGSRAGRTHFVGGAKTPLTFTLMYRLE